MGDFGPLKLLLLWLALASGVSDAQPAARRPIWRVDFRPDPYAPMSALRVPNMRRFNGAEIVESVMTYQTDRLSSSGLSFATSFKLSTHNPCATPAAVATSLKQYILVGCTDPTSPGCLRIFILGQCTVCFNVWQSQNPGIVCSPEPLIKGASYSVVGSFVPGGLAEMWVNGVHVSSEVSWTLEPSTTLYIGAHPAATQAGVAGGFVGQIGHIEIYDQPAGSSERLQLTAECGDGRVAHPYEQCDDGNKISGDGCSSSFLYTASSCSNMTHRPASLVVTKNSDTCKYRCSADQGCTAYLFDDQSMGCYLFGDEKATDLIPVWSDLGSGCCGVGAAVLRSEAVNRTGVGAQNWLGTCMELCEQTEQCGFISFGWLSNGVPSATCVVMGISAATECSVPLTNDGLSCGGQASLQSDHRVHTYKYLQHEQQCHLKQLTQPARCRIEPGWSCDGGSESEPDSCRPKCGDGTLVAYEQCDDANLAAGDGCSPSCEIEDGWICNAAIPSSCEPVCGDGQLSGNERCDDGNKLSGDGCSAQCQIEHSWECTDQAPSDCTRSRPTSVSIPYTAHHGIFSLLLSWAVPVNLGSELTHSTIYVNGLKYATRTSAQGSWLKIGGMLPDAQLRLQVSASSKAGTTELSDPTLARMHSLAPVYTLGGGGWKLVRHVAPPLLKQSIAEWHQAHDWLRGSDSYGDQYSEDPLSPNSFSLDFESEQFGQFMFATGDAAHWAIIPRLAVVGQPAGCNVAEIESSLGSAAVSCQIHNAQHEIEVSVSNSAQSFVLYQEASKPDLHTLRRHFGANVFIRQGTSQTTGGCQGSEDGDCEKFASAQRFTGTPSGAHVQDSFSIESTELGTPSAV